jgi:DNA-directed RNA polymerase specialized sigma24 family protein
MMPQPEDNITPSNPSTGYGAQFAPTSWTDVLAAQRSGSPESAPALEKLCTTYWYPLYAYLRRKGYDPHKAQDLNQEFFYRLLRENYLGAVDRRRGKFRSFLLAALNHFLSNQRDHEPRPSAKIFERNWFLTLFQQAMARMREEQVVAGRDELFDELKQFLIEDAEAGDYNAAAERVGMTANAVAVTVHRWRERYKKLVHEEIVRTVADPAEIEDELRRFFAVLEE